MARIPTVDELYQAGIIPDVIPKSAEFVPSVKITINYRSGNSVTGGNSLEVGVTASIPREIRFSSAPPEGYEYVLVMTDPDAPSRAAPHMREWAHWVVSSIKADSLEHGSSRGALNLLPYNGPSPPLNSGPHRYIFLLFISEAGKSCEISGLPATGDSRKAQRRGKWNGIGTAWHLGELNSLKLVGINWFLCEVKSR